MKQSNFRRCKKSQPERGQDSPIIRRVLQIQLKCLKETAGTDNVFTTVRLGECGGAS